MNKVKLLVILAFAMMTINCSEKGSSDPVPSFSDLYTNVFSQDCMDCHAPGGDAYETDQVEIDFSTKALAYSSLTSLNVTGVTSVGECRDIPIINSTASTSFLIGVLYEDYSQDDFAGVSGCTPYTVHHSDGMEVLSINYKSDMISWINNGAPNN